MTAPRPYEELRVLAYDPGVTTGIALRGRKGEYATMVTKDQDEAWEFIRPDRVDLVIFENFAAQRISKYGLKTVRVVGGIESRCSLHKIQIIKHTPQQRRAWIDIARKWLIENTGSKGTGQHEIDALSHIFCWEWMQEHPHGI